MADQPMFQALARLSASLQAQEVEQEHIDTILSSLALKIADQVAADVMRIVGQETLSSMDESVSLADKTQAIEQAFHEKEGISIDEYREKLAEQFVQEYESLDGAETQASE